MKPSVPKGTRDFSPVEMARRTHILSVIRGVYEKYGFQPIETPAMENTETLMGKYGDEGDKLIFRIFPRGRKIYDLIKVAKKFGSIEEAAPAASVKEEVTDPSLSPDERHNATIANILANHAEEALRYDLTVPFARYIVQHRNDITFPFKRYQIQPVWRADKPQKGRYREFYQCDADVIGSDSLLNEVELVQIISEVFKKLGVMVTIKVNNRKILAGIAGVIGEKEKIVDITVAIDKLDKIGADGVNKELKEKGISDSAIKQLQPLLSFSGSYQDKIEKLNVLIGKSEIGAKGIEEIKYMFRTIADCQLPIADLQLDITLARGLNYYTGAIFEVKANDVQIGSICGGGRYDDLTGIFGLPNVSGVGISFGIDRIYDVLEETGAFDKMGISGTSTKVMFAHFGEEERNYSLIAAATLRSAGINTEVYPDITKKINKQFDYANKKQIPFVVVVGGDEMKSGELTVKDMNKGEQVKLTLNDLKNKLNT